MESLGTGWWCAPQGCCDFVRARGEGSFVKFCATWLLLGNSFGGSRSLLYENRYMWMLLLFLLLSLSPCMTNTLYFLPRVCGAGYVSLLAARNSTYE